MHFLEMFPTEISVLKPAAIAQTPSSSEDKGRLSLMQIQRLFAYITRKSKVAYKLVPQRSIYVGWWLLSRKTET